MGDKRQELAALEQMLVLQERLRLAGAPAHLISTLQVLLGARREALHAQGIEADTSHLLVLDLSVASEEQLLAVLRQRHAEALAALQREHEQTLATLHERHQQEQMVAQLQQLLDEGKWDDFLQVVPYVPAALLAERMHWRFQIEELDERFRDAIDSYQLPIAQKLLMVLAALDKNLKAFDERKREYEALEQQLARELVDHRYERRLTQPRQLARPRSGGDDLLSVLEHLHRLLLEEHPALAPQLEALRQAVTQPLPEPNGNQPKRGNITTAARRLPVGLRRSVSRAVSHPRPASAHRRVPARVLRTRQASNPPTAQPPCRVHRAPPSALRRHEFLARAMPHSREGTPGRRATAAMLVARRHAAPPVEVPARRQREPLGKARRSSLSRSIERSLGHRPTAAMLVARRLAAPPVEGPVRWQRKPLGKGRKAALSRTATWSRAESRRRVPALVLRAHRPAEAPRAEPLLWSQPTPQALHREPSARPRLRPRRDMHRHPPTAATLLARRLAAPPVEALKRPVQRAPLAGERRPSLSRTARYSRRESARRIPAVVLRARRATEAPVLPSRRIHRAPHPELQRHPLPRTVQRPRREMPGRGPTAATVLARRLAAPVLEQPGRAQRLPLPGLRRVSVARTAQWPRQGTQHRRPTAAMLIAHRRTSPIIEHAPRRVRRLPAPGLHREPSRRARQRTLRAGLPRAYRREPAVEISVAPPSVETRAAQHAEVEALLEAGFVALERLTAEALRQAHTHLEQASHLSEGTLDRDLTAQIEAGQSLLRLLTEPLEGTMLASLEPLPDFQELLRLASNHDEAQRWVSSTSVLGWMEQARRIFQQARTVLSQGERVKGADLLSVSYALSQMVRHVAQEQWRAQLPQQTPQFTTIAAFQAEVRKVGQMLRR